MRTFKRLSLTFAIIGSAYVSLKKMSRALSQDNIAHNSHEPGYTVYDDPTNFAG